MKDRRTLNSSIFGTAGIKPTHLDTNLQLLQHYILSTPYGKPGDPRQLAVSPARCRIRPTQQPPPNLSWRGLKHFGVCGSNTHRWFFMHVHSQKANCYLRRNWCNFRHLWYRCGYRPGPASSPGRTWPSQLVTSCLFISNREKKAL